METACGPSRGGSAGATGAPGLPGIDYDAYRRKAARLRARAYRRAALAVRDGLAKAARRVLRAVMPFTDAAPGTCDTTIVSQSLFLNLQSPPAIYLPELLRANDNGAISRQSESA